jgi:hypothetical protein
MANYLRTVEPSYRSVGKSISHIISDDETIQEGSVGNKHFENISFNTALIMGTSPGIENGISSRFDYPLPWNSPKNAGEQWDFSSLRALYMGPFSYSYFTSMPWMSLLLNKVKQFVIDGGSIYISGESDIFVKYLAAAAEVGLSFYSSNELPIYSGSGLSRITLAGDTLRETVGTKEVLLPYTPFMDGPLIKHWGSAAAIAMAEVVLVGNGTAYIQNYPAAVSFPLGKGMVRWTPLSRQKIKIL